MTENLHFIFLLLINLPHNITLLPIINIRTSSQTTNLCCRISPISNQLIKFPLPAIQSQISKFHSQITKHLYTQDSILRHSPIETTRITIEFLHLYKITIILLIQTDVRNPLGCSLHSSKVERSCLRDCQLQD